MGFTSLTYDQVAEDFLECLGSRESMQFSDRCHHSTQYIEIDCYSTSRYLVLFYLCQHAQHGI